jgi:hypothetical protein
LNSAISVDKYCVKIRYWGSVFVLSKSFSPSVLSG